jgi:hypothetical protein
MDSMRHQEKRFVVVTAATGPEAPWDAIKAEQRRAMGAFGKMTELNAYSDSFVSQSGLEVFSCYVDTTRHTTWLGVFPEKGIHELLQCIAASLPQHGDLCALVKSGHDDLEDEEALAEGERLGELDEGIKVLRRVASMSMVTGALLVAILLLQVWAHNRRAHAAH